METSHFIVNVCFSHERVALHASIQQEKICSSDIISSEGSQRQDDFWESPCLAGPKSPPLPLCLPRLSEPVKEVR